MIVIQKMDTNSDVKLYLLILSLFKRLRDSRLVHSESLIKSQSQLRETLWWYRI